MEEILKFIAEDGYVMVPVLLILGVFIKNSKFIPDGLIPFILLTVSLILTPMLLGGFNAYNIAQSVLVTGGAVLVNQGYKQFLELKE